MDPCFYLSNIWLLGHFLSKSSLPHDKTMAHRVQNIFCFIFLNESLWVNYGHVHNWKTEANHQKLLTPMFCVKGIMSQFVGKVISADQTRKSASKVQWFSYNFLSFVFCLGLGCQCPEAMNNISSYLTHSMPHRAQTLVRTWHVSLVWMKETFYSCVVDV